MAETATSDLLDKALDTLRRSQALLRRGGIAHAAVFGSVARRQDRPDSDVDVLVDLMPDAAVDLLDIIRLERVLSRELGRPVELTVRDRLKPAFRAGIEREAVRAY
ncbi:MAG: nucleotidyltransferase domain-containing protein [Alphaproteobacteria bacterium]|nr:nucleotidyltransferase domain-containing protein [Alphaproteobacteria bacterium]MBU0795695.1 nucleotidyltransferase domain-containing protein [Alphaproteobacteria bacterium]MBU0887318.1 nucleotidyltransferase domain-containing protein [Alphaproteobacteria bacterium]MBU1811801.1 nucleotidyltransferase domain-containing protein [Alphaproteobacteria bacterium]MBU2089662.1 nucleotidyltransferase domain-containing protein [Alphaproteobacteria bacterium]